MDPEKVKLHEQFVLTSEGCTMAEVLWVTLPSHLFTVMIIVTGVFNTSLSHTCSYNCQPKDCKLIVKKKFKVFIKEFILIIIPLILIVTIYSNVIIPYVLLICITIIITVLVKNRHKLKNHKIPINSYDLMKLFRTPINDDKRSFITCCRSIVNIMTIICILAVDFNIFPRRFSKTETYGISLMDVGVGFFIFCNAGVIKSEKIINEGFKTTLLGSTVMCLLGLFRYFSVQRINYQKNIIEYGVHWNFFFTLASVKITSCLIIKLFKQTFWPGVVLSILHQSLLYFGLEEYVTGQQERTNWIDANREGLVSSLGYTSLFLIGVSLQKFILKNRTTVGGDLKIAAKLLCISLSLLAVTVMLSEWSMASRRLVNITYITWVVAAGLLHIMVAMLVDLSITCIVPNQKYRKLYSFLTPILFDSVNDNGLIFFLVGNVLTGVVNILFDTMKMGFISSILVLITYMFTNCTIVMYMYFGKVKMKFW